MERFEYQRPDILLRKLELSDVGYWNRGGNEGLRVGY